MNWSLALDAEVERIAGPFDESDEVNHDPDSLLGEEDEGGFDDDSDGADPLFVEDEGFEDVEGEEGDDSEEDDGDDEWRPNVTLGALF
jgi:hypothetical protein